MFVAPFQSSWGSCNINEETRTIKEKERQILKKYRKKGEEDEEEEEGEEINANRKKLSQEK